METAAFFLIAFLSDVAGTLAGFGSSTIFLPFALLFHDFPAALALVGFAHVFGNAGRLAFFRRGLDRKTLVAFGAASVAFSLAGAMLVPRVPVAGLRAALGAFLIAFVLFSLARARFRLPAAAATSVAGGAVSGFLAGLIGTGGALRGAFLSALRLPKEAYIATAAALAILTDLTRIPVYLAQGALSARQFLLVPGLLVTSLAGAFVGRKLVERVSQETFRRIVLAALALAGAFLVIRR